MYAYTTRLTPAINSTSVVPCSGAPNTHKQTNKHSRTSTCMHIGLLHGDMQPNIHTHTWEHKRHTPCVSACCEGACGHNGDLPYACKPYPWSRHDYVCKYAWVYRRASTKPTCICPRNRCCGHEMIRWISDMSSLSPHICMYVCMQVCKYACVYTRMHVIYTYACVYTFTVAGISYHF